MKKIILLALVIMSATLANGQILYKISGNGLKKASYIIGTHHLVDETFASQIPGIDKAIKKTKQVYGEVVMSHLMSLDTLQMMQEAMMLPDETTIKDILDPEHYNKLNELLLELVGTNLDNPLLFSSLGKMKPAAIESQIEALMYLKEFPGKFDPNKGIDMYFQNQALREKKTVGGLESCKFQIDMLFNSITIEQQVESFNCLLDNLEANKKQLIVLTDAYRKQDAQAIVDAMNMKFGNECDELNEKDMEKMLTMRNNNWLAIMLDIMKKAPTLFVVGSGHLLDETGVITLLRKAGYTVEPVK